MIEKMKVVHIVAAASEKTALLDRLRALGIVHFGEKASADQRHLERFAELSRMEMLLQEYTGQEPEKKLLSDKEFEVFYKDLAACIDRHKALQEQKTAVHAAAERLSEWGAFSPAELRSLKDQGLDIHIYRTDKKTAAALAADPDVRVIRLAPVGKMPTLASIGPLPASYPVTEFPIPEKGLEELNRDVTEKLQTLQSVFDSVSGNLSALGDKLSRYQEAIQSTGTTLSGAIQLSSTLRGDLGQLAQDMDRIVTSDGFRRFVEVLENDPEGLADYLSDPVSMETVPVYGITTYGSAMAPYYIMLALFVGSLLTATMLHVNAPMPELFRLRPWQRFFGRYQLFFLIGMIQALVTGLGCVYYIGMQCLHPGLFLLACCVCSLNFTMMNYALVYALDNIGMAASVIIMVIQVAGSGGVYPIDVLPGIFQTLYKFMPFHYGMDMLRETIAGRYENVYWKNLAVMAAMCVLFAVLGMVLYYPARPLNRLIARSKEKSGIM